MNDLQARLKSLTKRAKKVKRSLTRCGSVFLLKMPESRDCPVQEHYTLDTVELVILELEDKRAEIDLSIDSTGRSEVTAANVAAREKLFASFVEEK